MNVMDVNEIITLLLYDVKMKPELLVLMCTMPQKEYVAPI